MKIYDSPEDLGPNEIFVFGSNLAGIHGAGAALSARRHFGAEVGIGYGPTGRCYALPTKDEYIKTLDLQSIDDNVDDFKRYAAKHPGMTFVVTPIGCGLAGYTPRDIAPMFKGCPPNVVLPEEFNL